ncbi:MAG: lamin tail domain-containing protein, partial [Patescibacteria group bacterium]
SLEAQADSTLPILISEVASFETSATEWVEIVNRGTEPIDMTGFTFLEDGTRHRLEIYSGDFMVDAGEYAVIVNKPVEWRAKYPDFTGTVFDSSWSSLNLAGEEIGIVDSSDNFIDRGTYIASVNNKSIERIDEATWEENPESHSMGSGRFFQTDETDTTDAGGSTEDIDVADDAGTDGSDTTDIGDLTDDVEEVVIDDSVGVVDETADEIPVETVATATPPQLLLYEISFKDSTGDWIELLMTDDMNGGGYDLAGFELFDDKVFYTIPAGTVLHTGEFLIIENLKLTGTSEEVVLRTPAGSVVDAVCWMADDVTESEEKDLSELAAVGGWISEDPLDCIGSDDIGSNKTIGRTGSEDTNTREDWVVLPRSTKGSLNEIRNNPPIVIIEQQSGTETLGEAPLSINVTAGSSYDPDGDAITFFWDFGDGTIYEKENPPAHTYLQPGTYQLSLRVEDAIGAVSESSIAINALQKQTTDDNKTACKETPPITTPPPPPAPAPAPAPAPQEPIPMCPGTIVLDGKKVPLVFQASVIDEKISDKKKPGAYMDGDLSDDIIISEIFPSPGGSASDEWIELLNMGEYTVSLGNWRLDDDEGGSKPYVFPDTYSITPGEHLIITRGESKLALNNSSDAVRLFDFGETLIDDIAYEKAGKDMAFAIINVKNVTTASGKSDLREWRWTSSPTPGTANPVFETIEGKVKNMAPQEMSLTLSSSDLSSTQIHFTEEVLDPALAPLALPEGADVQVLAQRESDNTIILREILQVTPGKLPAEADSKRPWFLVTIAIILGLSGVAGYVFLKKKSYI